MWTLLWLSGCTEYSLGEPLDPPDVSTQVPTEEPATREPEAGSPLRDTDGDGVPDDQDPDIDGDGIPNPLDPDPDGDGQPGYTLPYDPADDPVRDPETGLPELQVGSARGRVCAPNGTTWVAGADVTVLTPAGPFQTVSNGDGWWQVDGLEPGEYGVVITKGSFYLTYNVTIEDGVVTEQVFDECLVQGDLTIAVVDGAWDHIEDVLADLGLEFDEFDGDIQGGVAEDAAVTNLLTNPTALAQYDIVFLNCGISEVWATNQQALVGQTLRDYVEAGGSIYASDWSYYTIEASFPDKLDFYGEDSVLGDARVGGRGFVDGLVLDPAMANLLGTNAAQINFDLPEWVVMEGQDASAETLVEADLGTFRAPLASRFTSGQGRVIYTSFHNEVQATFDMQRMLEEIVLSL